MHFATTFLFPAGHLMYQVPSLILLVMLCCSVGIATDCGLDGPGSNPGGDEIFRSSRPALESTQPSVKWVPGLSWG